MNVINKLQLIRKVTYYELYKTLAIPRQKIKIIKRVKGRVCVIQSLCAFSNFIVQYKV